MTLTVDALPAALAAYRLGLLDRGIPEDVASVAMLDLGRELCRHLDLTGIKLPTPDISDAAAAKRRRRAQQLADEEIQP